MHTYRIELTGEEITFIVWRDAFCQSDAIALAEQQHPGFTVTLITEIMDNEVSDV